MKIAAIGGGVIGGGWIARFILSGHDVSVYDPHPEAARILGEVMANATRAWERLFQAPLPRPGRVIWAGSVAEAVAGADYVQESGPERLDLKHRIRSTRSTCCRWSRSSVAAPRPSAPARF